MVVPDDDPVAGEGEIGVSKAEQRRHAGALLRLLDHRLAERFGLFQPLRLLLLLLGHLLAGLGLLLAIFFIILHCLVFRDGDPGRRGR